MPSLIVLVVIPLVLTYIAGIVRHFQKNDSEEAWPVKFFDAMIWPGDLMFWAGACCTPDQQAQGQGQGQGYAQQNGDYAYGQYGQQQRQQQPSAPPVVIARPIVEVL